MYEISMEKYLSNQSKGKCPLHLVMKNKWITTTNQGNTNHDWWPNLRF